MRWGGAHVLLRHTAVAIRDVSRFPEVTLRRGAPRWRAFIKTSSTLALMWKGAAQFIKCGHSCKGLGNELRETGEMGCQSSRTVSSISARSAACEYFVGSKAIPRRCARRLPELSAHARRAASSMSK
jgi:hypothetical protein